MVQLHVTEELLGLLDGERDSNSLPKHTLCAMLDATLQGHEPPLTIRLQGVVHGQKVLMPVDSGSTHSFVSEAIASS
jgi:hypothetical protein